MIPNRETNLLINGGIDFAQRVPVAATTLTTSLVYLLDRWLAQKLGTWTVAPTLERYSVDKPSNSSVYCARLAAMSATDATATVYLQQRIESLLSRFALGT